MLLQIFLDKSSNSNNFIDALVTCNTIKIRYIIWKVFEKCKGEGWGVATGLNLLAVCAAEVKLCHVGPKYGWATFERLMNNSLHHLSDEMSG